MITQRLTCLSCSTTLQLGSAKALGPELEDYYNRLASFPLTVFDHLQYMKIWKGKVWEIYQVDRG